MPPSAPEDTAWFAAHVQAHEPMLRAWLQSRFPAESDFDDIVQEAYLRVLRARQEQGGLEAPKAFLFAIARNLARDRMRHRRVAPSTPLVDDEGWEILPDADDVAENVARNQELELLTKAIQLLPERCRQVFTLRKVYGMSQADIARKLQISECTVSAQLTIGVHKCSEFMAHYRREPKRP